MTNIPTDFVSVGIGLYIYKLCGYDFRGTVVNAVHSLYPFELVLGFEVFGDVFVFYHLGYESVEHLLSLCVNLCTVLV